MRILRRIPVQYTYLDGFIKDDVRFPNTVDLNIKNEIHDNKPWGGIYTHNVTDEIESLIQSEKSNIVKLYPKKDLKLLLFDARYDNNVKNIPVYFGEKLNHFNDREYKLDELVKLYGKAFVDYRSVSLDYEKLQRMGLDGVHVVNNDSPLFQWWKNGTTLWFNTRWIKSIESVNEHHNKIVPCKAGKENG